MNRPRMLWPVYGHRNGMAEPVATCFDYGAAADLAMHPGRDGFYDRNLYIGEPRYDPRIAQSTECVGDPLLHKQARKAA